MKHDDLLYKTIEMSNHTDKQKFIKEAQNVFTRTN